MTAARVLAVLQQLAAFGIPVWLHGGWGIDALLGRQTRSHDDLDLVIRLEDAARIESALHDVGYVYTGAGPPVRGQNVIEYLVDGEGHQVDVHPISITGEDWVPANGFAGVGHILGCSVRCLTPEVMLHSHATGYALDADHQRDVASLSERFGIPLPKFQTAQQGD
jgi:lincosamide nucleotidyltransferase A/C/D/E